MVKLQRKFSIVYWSKYKLYQIVIELACGDHGNDKIKKMAREIDNGKCLVWTGFTDLRIDDDTPSGIDYFV